MKILYVTTVGLTMRFFESLILELINDGNVVDIACNESSSKVDDIYRELGCNVYQIGCSRSPLSKNNLMAIKEIRKIVVENNYDVVHCHTPIAGVATRLACRKLRKNGLKVFYTAHGFHFFDGAPLKNWLIYYPIEKFLSRFTDVLITINKEDYERAKKFFHAKETYYIHGVGFDTSKFANCIVDRNKKLKEIDVDNNAFILLSVGELHDRKNHQIVIEALNQLKDTNIVYIIAGSGINQSKYERLISEYGLQKNIKIIGFREDINELCKAVDCFVHPSIREGLGIAPLEAMASGLPLIAAYVNGIKDYAVDGITGRCVDPRNVNQMCYAILELKNNNDFRKACAENNIEIARQFDQKISNEEMKNIYHSVMDE